MGPGNRRLCVRKRPVIGILTQTQEVAGQAPHAWSIGSKYVEVLAAAGAIPWLIPLLRNDAETLGCLYERLDGLFLTGGVDVDPANYHESRHERCGVTDPDRDWTELTLIRWAVANHKPILGVCRGIQVLNVAGGGTLYQDLAAQHPHPIKHDYFSPGGSTRRDYLAHEVHVVPDSRLAAVLSKESVPVNSMHHQGIKDLAPGLTASAFAPDGLIEGVEGRNEQFLLGVQWHPEELADGDPLMRRLFTAFVAAAGPGRIS
jgi:putative glutamine amidotransferase